ncbi:hypothetical protein FJY70_02980 [candidate division WOR-3 bacterium]|nr:hypothetical protein [candidate division WOR-3 bacterium]
MHVVRTSLPGHGGFARWNHLKVNPAHRLPRVPPGQNPVRNASQLARHPLASDDNRAGPQVKRMRCLWVG